MAPRWSPILALIPATAAFKSMTNSTTLDPNNIICPVLAALYNTGALVVDDFGIAERAAIKSALIDGTAASPDFGEFQSGGISAYDWTHKHDQSSRDRCLPGLTLSGTHCFNKWIIGRESRETKRYLNIFEMNGLETVEHGASSGVRGGNCNSKEENDPCNGQYPCQALFDKFYTAHADSNGRIYKQQILEIICHIMAEGDRGGEFAYHDAQASVPGIDVKLPARQWQVKAAMLGWLSAFGREDADGELYFTVADAKKMLMHGTVPDDWYIRRWGCVTKVGGCPTMPNGKKDQSFLSQVNEDLPCNQYDEWWGGATTTGQSCRSDSSCSDAHALCLTKRCTCGKGRNGRQMLFAGGACKEQGTVRQYNGRDCRFTRADAPDSPTVWPSFMTEVV